MIEKEHCSLEQGNNIINIVEKLDLNSKSPGKLKYNQKVFEKYKDKFDNISEFIYYYKHGYSSKPKCINCGKELKFNVKKFKYSNFCSLECGSHHPNTIKKRINTMSKLDENNLSIFKKSGQKIKQTRKNNIDNNGLNSYERAALKRLTTYNENGLNSYQYGGLKAKQTQLSSIDQNGLNGYDRMNLKKLQTIDEYGLNSVQRGCVKDYLTKKKHNTFNKSFIENKIYKKLLNNFAIEDVIRQYKSKEYPFACDFYIKSLKLYIEYHGSWTHGKHSKKVFGTFDKNNQEHIALLNKWTAKKSKYYDNAIKTWTERDPLKLEYFKKTFLPRSKRLLISWLQ